MLIAGLAVLVLPTHELQYRDFAYLIVAGLDL